MVNKIFQINNNNNTQDCNDAKNKEIALLLASRTWYRVQRNCSTFQPENQPSQIDINTDMVNKNNILQYKANSNNLSKAQRYAKIARGQWINRHTTWASQSMSGYSNPNINSLKRQGNVVTC